MEAFRPASGGGARARFEPPEAALLRDLIELVMTMLDDRETGEDGPDHGGAGVLAPDGPDGPDAPDAPDGPGGGPDGLGGPDATGPADLPTPAELDAMLGLGEPSRAPEDPALARLLPDAYRDDPDAAGEFRRYTEQSLRSAKQETARAVLDTLPAAGGPVKLAADQAQAWLRALNDLRLVLGVRLGVTEEFEDQWEELDPADPVAAAFGIYAWLGEVQESLVQALA
jgi:hypothetical protein